MGTKSNNNKKAKKNKPENIKYNINTNEFDDAEYDGEYDDLPNISNTVSSTELTGLMYRPPQNDEELEAYKDLSTMPLPKKTK